MTSSERPSTARLAELDRIARRIGYQFLDPSLLDRALTHASLGNEGLPSYERLEFLGDAVLGFVVADRLFRHRPEFLEGELTDLRARHVSREPLAAVARNLGLTNALSVGRGLRTEELGSERIQADIVEAVLGAVYLDGGLRAAREFVRRHVLVGELANAEFGRKTRDPKSRLLHLAQRRSLGQPRYRLIDTDGPDHARSFRVGVLIAEQEYGIGKARSKQAAEMIAAERAIERLESESTDADAGDAE
ncbi:MAG: ribonuclease III [Planctomycetes bacterium]|nr:ribonuclease III [Planctomycetota bacterium]